ncbi:hypothetical protein HFP66_02295 [Bacillus sp. A17A.1]
MDSVTPFVKGVEILPDGSVARTGTNYGGKFQEAHDASKASIQSRISNLESGGVKGTGEGSTKVKKLIVCIREVVLEKVLVLKQKVKHQKMQQEK